MHNETKPIILKGVAEKREEKLNQYEEPLAALQWKVSQSVHINFTIAFQFTKQAVDIAYLDLMINITPLYCSYHL
jgi:hypothetical protein